MGSVAVVVVWVGGLAGASVWALAVAGVAVGIAVEVVVAVVAVAGGGSVSTEAAQLVWCPGLSHHGPRRR